MSDKNKILDLAKEYLNLSSEEDLASFDVSPNFRIDCLHCLSMHNF